MASVTSTPPPASWIPQTAISGCAPTRPASTPERTSRLRRVDKDTNVISTIAGDGIAGFAGDFDLPASGSRVYNPLTLARDGLRLEWPTTVLGSGLQRTTTLTNPVWQDVPGSASVNSIVLPVDDLTAFFRLVQP